MKHQYLRLNLGILAAAVASVALFMGIVALHGQQTAYDTLHRVASLIDEKPDSASVLMGQIDPTGLTTDGTKALYALMNVRLATIYNSLPSDNDLNTALNFYKNRLGERGRYVQALVCYGLKQRRQGDVKGATITLRTAHDKVAADDYLNRGIIEYCLAQLYEENYGMDRSRVANRYMAALAFYNAAGSRRFALIAASSCARAYRKTRPALADSCLERALSLANQLGNKTTYYDNLEYKARIMAEKGQYADALHLAKRCLNEWKGRNGNDAYYGMAIAYAGLGKADSAQLWLQKAKSDKCDPYDEITRYETMSHVASIEGKPDLSHSLDQASHHIADSLSNNPQMRTVTYAEGEYDATAASSSHRSTLWFWGVIAAIIAIGAAAAAITALRHRRYRADMERFEQSLKNRE